VHPRPGPGRFAAVGVAAGSVPAMSGTDDPAHRQLDRLLRELSARRRPGVFTYVTVAGPEAIPAGIDVEATVREPEGLSVVVEVRAAAAAGWTVGYRAAWITCEVLSALDAVGLTAAIATALAAEGISANVVAGHHHDHVLVAEDDADRALAVLGRWSDQPTSSA